MGPVGPQLGLVGPQLGPTGAHLGMLLGYVGLLVVYGQFSRIKSSHSRYTIICDKCRWGGSMPFDQKHFLFIRIRIYVVSHRGLPPLPLPYPHPLTLRPLLTKCCFRSSGRVSISLQNGNFFFILPFFGGKIFIIFLPKMKDKNEGQKNCSHRTGHNFGHPLDRKQTLFKG